MIIYSIASSLKSLESLQTKGKNRSNANPPCHQEWVISIITAMLVVLVTMVMTMRIMKQGVGYASACAPRWMGPVGGLPRPARPIDDQKEEEGEMNSLN